ncbi:cytochrome c biogenesis CcdA family protein [Halococcus thailandensis]|uniref:Cytochrome c-type biogenesis protein n=1 Tax=Halococcus thailandensis JCM 13552 TaxID=1227457 RepID=M0NE00_9EURY|nr:cytochrome c biogenesis protein CcdA [Halococcus thailandensis]EMA56051.1 cytochrome c-type biogenesis protein [Halococcus thailandensis JCM 13552]
MTSAALLGTVAFAAGAGLTTFFAPCAFPLLPGYVGYYVHQSQEETSSVLSAVAAAVGALIALGVVAGLAFAFGEALTSLLPLLEPIVGAGLIVFGLVMLIGRFPIASIPLPARPESIVGFGVFGGVYALAAAGCVIPLFLGVLTQALTLPPLAAVVVLGSYAGAVAAPLVGVTLLTSVGVDTWHDLGWYSGRIEQFAGVILIAAGIGQLYLSIVVLDVL